MDFKSQRIHLMEQFYKHMPNDVEIPAVSDDQQALHMEDRAIADIYRARKERHDRILLYSSVIGTEFLLISRWLVAT